MAQERQEKGKSDVRMMKIIWNRRKTIGTRRTKRKNENDEITRRKRRVTRTQE